MPAVPQPSATVQRPYPQRIGKPPPLQPENRVSSWTFKDGYRPDYAAYYGQQTYPFRAYYGGGLLSKESADMPYHSVQQYGGTVAPGPAGQQQHAPSYAPSWREYTARGRYTQNPGQDKKDQHSVDPNALRAVGADVRTPKRPSEEERAFYEQELARDAARMASSALSRDASYSTDHGRTNQGHMASNPQKSQPAKEEFSKCALCGKYAQFLCSGCQSVWYCGPQCQKSNWNNHSSHCHSIKSTVTEKHVDGQQRASL